MPAVVRPAVLADAAGIARVQTLGWQHGFAGLLPAEFLSARLVTSDRWSERLRDSPEGMGIFVAVSDDEIIGFVLVGPAEEEACSQLYAIYLLAEHWGTGVGHRLHAAGVAALRAGGFAEAILWSLRNNDRTNAFYERHGWRDDGVDRDDLEGDVVLPIRRYRLDLALAETLGELGG